MHCLLITIIDRDILLGQVIVIPYVVACLAAKPSCGLTSTSKQRCQFTRIPPTFTCLGGISAANYSMRHCCLYRHSAVDKLFTDQVGTKSKWVGNSAIRAHRRNKLSRIDKLRTRIMSNIARE